MSNRDVLQFAILGRTVHAHDVPALHGWLNAYWRFADHDLPPHPYTIRIDTVEALPVLDDGVAQVIRIPGFEQTWHHAGEVWQTRAGGMATRLTLMPEHAHITLEHATPSGAARSAAGELNAERFAAVYTALSEAVRASGLIALHAAVIARDDTATLLLGPSGTGKTTTLLRAVKAGWAPVAEDLVWLDPSTLRVYGWDRGVRLWPGTTQGLVPDATEDAWDVAADGKLFMPWERLTVPRVPSAMLARIVLLERGGPGSRAGRAGRDAAARTPLTGHDMVRALWEAAGVPLAHDARARVASAISALIPRIAAERLQLNGRDPVTAFR